MKMDETNESRKKELQIKLCRQNIIIKDNKENPTARCNHIREWLASSEVEAMLPENGP